MNVVTGDGFVTLYWDDIAESSFDRFMADRGASGFDFEGYKIYRGTEPAFKDVFTITDADGILTFNKPMAQFDLIDGVTGLHPDDINGIKYRLGDDTGLSHFWTDTDVQNGQTYYYAVTAYDFGGPEGEGIAPSETPIAVSVQPDGSVILGSNVVEVVPGVKPVGYVEAEYSEITHEGFSSSDVFLSIIDPTKILDNNSYLITFVDTTIKSAIPQGEDTLTTKWFNLLNVTSADTDTILFQNTKFNASDEPQFVDGFLLSFVMLRQ